MSENSKKLTLEERIDKYLRERYPDEEYWTKLWDSWFTSWDWCDSNDDDNIISIWESWHEVMTISKKELIDAWVLYEDIQVKIKNNILTLKTGYYQNKRKALLLVDSKTGEDYMDLTVNLPEDACKFDEVYIDINNPLKNDINIEDILLDNNILTEKVWNAQSWFLTYPRYGLSEHVLCRFE